MALPLANPSFEPACKVRPATIRFSGLSQLLTFWHLASFDAPTVAVVWALAFAQAAGVHLQPWIGLLLFSGTWTVYVGDRLLDARRAMHSGQFGTLRERHFFHWRYRWVLFPLAACSAVLAAFLIVDRMPVIIRERNSLLAAAALAYFSGVHSTPRPPTWLGKIGAKELLVGVLFTAGCAAPTLSHFAAAGIAGRWPLIACLAFFAALAWCNCRAIESWEAGKRESHVPLQAGLLSLAGAMMAAGLALIHPGAAALAAVGAASSLLLLMVDRIRYRISTLMLRTLADVVLLAPVVLLAWGAHPA